MLYYNHGLFFTIFNKKKSIFSMIRKAILGTLLRYKSHFKISTILYKPIEYKFTTFENKNKFTNKNNK